MDIKIDEEFFLICKEIIDENKSEDEWSEIESDDMFQSASYCGGYDADEESFCFSYYDSDKKEFWFQITLKEVKTVVEGKLNILKGRPTE
ncbi:MAG: hypothetical protein MJE63_01110 [Proteobacteria bacterium]|nr:hypothetical protein [Pseudomonadota bacterium]